MTFLSDFWCRLRAGSPPGVRGEREAARALKRSGYRILARNLRNRYGEVDILAEAPDGRTIVIVEVKTRELTDGASGGGNDAVRPEVRVNLAKQRKLAALAAQIARAHRLTDRPIRFDVIGVDLFADGRRPEVRHHVAAFESPM